jgi:hypothetical protein
MLPAVNDGDSGCREIPVPFLFRRHCPRGYLAWFSHVFSPFGDFTLTTQPPIPAGLTLSPQALLPVCPTVEAATADATSTAAD